jgi:Cys-rich protein (TIGR01571 family)
MSFYLAVITTALLFEPTGASRGFLEPKKHANLLPDLSSIGAQDSELGIRGDQHFTSLRDTVAFGLNRLGAGWMLTVQPESDAAAQVVAKSPDGRTEVIDIPSQHAVTWGQYFGQMTGSWATWLFVVLAFYGCGCYRNRFLPIEPKASPADNINPELVELFENGHWRCTQDSTICIYSFLCPALRWADTTELAGFPQTWGCCWGFYQEPGFWKFWAAFFAFQGIVLLDLIGNGSAFGLFSALLLLYFRSQLRDKLGVDRTCCSYFSDFCFVLWCSCCAIAQEARIVQKGIENGYTDTTGRKWETAAPEPTPQPAT